MADTGIKFRWKGEVAEVDLNDLTFREAEDIERTFGGPLREFRESVFNGYVSSMKILVWMAHRKSNPELKFSDLDNEDLSAVEVVHDEGESPDPQPAGDGPAEPSV